jgi:hypothetical protein
MPELPAAIPPPAYVNPHLCLIVTASALVRWARQRWSRSRRTSEVRMLERIPVLPAAWDAGGRHATRTDPIRPPGADAK